MNKQPEALFIAECIDPPQIFVSPAMRAEAAAELRRLHEANQVMLEALKEAVATIEDYLDYDHNGDPWTEDARSMGEMDVNDYKRDGRLDRARSAIAKGEQQ